MSRAIKYKAWAFIQFHTFNGQKWEGEYEMCEVLTLHFNKQNARVRYGNNTPNVFFKDLILREFTGKTENGIEIYEGDIVKHIIESDYLEKEDWETVTGTVKMIDGCWCVGESRYPLFSFTNEVLGNIYENPTFPSLNPTVL